MGETRRMGDGQFLFYEQRSSKIAERLVKEIWHNGDFVTLVTEARRARESEERLLEVIREAIESLNEGLPGAARQDLQNAIFKWERENG